MTMEKWFSVTTLFVTRSIKITHTRTHGHTHARTDTHTHTRSHTPTLPDTRLHKHTYTRLLAPPPLQHTHTHTQSHTFTKEVHLHHPTVVSLLSMAGRYGIVPGLTPSSLSTPLDVTPRPPRRKWRQLLLFHHPPDGPCVGSSLLHRPLEIAPMSANCLAFCRRKSGTKSTLRICRKKQTKKPTACCACIKVSFIEFSISALTYRQRAGEESWRQLRFRINRDNDDHSANHSRRKI